MDRYDTPSGRRTDGNGDFIGALLETLQQIITRRAGVTPLPDARTDRRYTGLAGSQGGQMPGPEAVRAMRDMLAPSGETVSPDRQGGRSGAGAPSCGAQTRDSQGGAGVPSGGEASGDPLLERIAARLTQMGLVDTDENGGAGGNGANVPRRPDGYR